MSTVPPARRLRVAMVGQRGVPATFGGIERAVEEIGAGLCARGHDVTVFCRPGYSAGTPQGRYRGMRLVTLPSPDSKHLEAFVHSGIAAAATVGRGYDVVHFHALGPGLFTPLPRWLSGAKVVQTIHGRDDQRAKWGRGAQGALRLAAWMSARVPDATVVVSADLAQHYSQHYGRATTHIGNGVVAPAPSGAGVIRRDLGLEPTSYVLFVGRLVPEKSVDVLLRAYRDVPGDLRLVIVGGSSHTDGYVEQLHALAASDPRVVLAGYRYGEALSELFAGAAAFVLPSAIEGLPLTLLEAAAHGAPIVASDIPPHVEVLGTSAAGRRLFAVGSEEGLAVALTELLAEGEAGRAAAADFGRTVAASHTWSAVAERTEALYLELLGRRS